MSTNNRSAISSDPSNASMPASARATTFAVPGVVASDLAFSDHEVGTHRL
ncbi:hypothetical protein [Halococcus sediminicola]|nr:hypothetical protein [Halococcus sediminicola]